MSNSKSNLFSVLLLTLIIPVYLFGFHEILTHRENPAEVIFENEFSLDTVDEMLIAEKVEKAVRNQFYENVGQISNPDVKFYGNIPDGMIGFAESGIFLWMDGAESEVYLSFENSASVMPCGVGEVNHRSNYFLGNHGSFTNIRGFTGVSYDDLWPGISLVYYATVNGAKYEYRVAPGANPLDIRVQCYGQDSLVIEKTTLKIVKDNGITVDEALSVFQENIVIDGEFRLVGNNAFGFNIDFYDNTKMLVIDPLLYSTFVGGSLDEGDLSMDIDASGNIYVAGYTSSTNFPIVNALDTSQNGGQDCFVFRFNFTSNEMIYSTYIGGGDDESIGSIVIDDVGNAYATGYTNSADFPIMNAYDTSHNGGQDCFAFKLNATGNGLVYSTFIGSSLNEEGSSITIDTSGNAFITGNTFSSAFPTVNAYDSSHNGDRDCFVLKLNSAGNGLDYSTFIGDSSADYGYSIAIDTSGNAYVTGYTNSPAFPAVNAYSSWVGGSDCFVLKLNSTGNGLNYSTCLGGFDGDYGYSIAIDTSGNAYVTGYTSSTNFPTLNAYNDTHSGGDDCFVLKLNSTGNGLNYSTYIGGSTADYGNSIVIDALGNSYVTGFTNSVDFPTLNAYDSTFNGGVADCFVLRLNSTGNGLNYSTYIGEGHTDYGTSLVIDTSGNVFVTGLTRSAYFPLVNAFDSELVGYPNWHGFILKLGNDNVFPYLNSPSDISYEEGTTGNQITWIVGDTHPYQYSVDGNGTTIGWTNWSNGSIIVNVDGLSAGVYTHTISVRDAASNQVVDTVLVTVTDTTIPDLSSPEDFTYEAGVTGNQITWDAGDINPYQYRVDGNGTTVEWTAWSNGSIIVDVDGLTPGVYNHTITVSDDHSNIAKDTVFVTVVDTTPPNIDHPADIQYEISATGNMITWSPSDLNPATYEILKNDSTEQSDVWNGSAITISVDALALGIYNYTLVVHDSSGNWVSDTVFVTVIPAVTTTTTTTTTTTSPATTTTTTTTTSSSTTPEGLYPLILAGGAGLTGLIVVIVIIVLSRRKPKKRKPTKPSIEAEDVDISEEVTPSYIPDTEPMASIERDIPAIEIEAPEAVAPVISPDEPEVIVEEVPEEVIEKTVKTFRGCEVIGGKFEYKVKIKNDTDFLIVNATVTIVGFPEDCMEIAGPTMKKVARIEPGGFRSPQFTFTPTKDCVEGQISTSVSYLDHMNQTQMIKVEPYTIRSVCDLLTPLESSLEEFDFMLGDMAATTEKKTFNWNAEVLFEKTKTMLSAKNFYIIEAKDETVDGEFRGSIRGLAKGKYTGKRVALRLIISGPADGTQAKVEVEGLGEDIAMLPTTIDEISKGIDSWTCMNCGGALNSNEVTRIKSGENVECRYCRHIMTIDLYRR